MAISIQHVVELKLSQTTSCIEVAALCNYEIDSDRDFFLLFMIHYCQLFQEVMEC